MAVLSTKLKRLILRRQATLATASSITLRQQLDANLNTRADAVLTGQAIASTSGNGHSVSFSEPGKGAPGSDAVGEYAEEMIVRYERAVATLGGTPTDAEILEAMLLELSPVKWSTNSFLALRR